MPNIEQLKLLITPFVPWCKVLIITNLMIYISVCFFKNPFAAVTLKSKINVSNFHSSVALNCFLPTTQSFTHIIVTLCLTPNIDMLFLDPLAVGLRAYVMVCCPAVRPSVRACVNFFFKHLLLWNYLSDFDEITQKCSCHGPLQIFLMNLIPSKTLIAMATKLSIFEIFENLLVRNHEAKSYQIWHVALPNGSLSIFFLIIALGSNLTLPRG